MLTATDNFEVVEEAQNGLQALELCRAHRPVLVLMDLSMPVMDGLEATRKIKGEFPWTSVLVLTIYEDRECLWQAILAGAAGYALKMTTTQELIETVRKVLRGEFPVAQEVATQVLGRLVRETRKNKESEQFSPQVHPWTSPKPPPCDEPMGSKRSRLTAHEVEILRLVARGYTNREIAKELSIARNTAKTTCSTSSQSSKSRTALRLPCLVSSRGWLLPPTSTSGSSRRVTLPWLLEAAARYSPAFSGIRMVNTSTPGEKTYVECKGGEKEIYDLNKIPTS